MHRFNLSGDFLVYDHPAWLNIDLLFEMIEDKNTAYEEVDVDDIFYFDLYSTSFASKINIKSERYKRADTNYPVILIKKSKGSKKYMMVDGRRRLLKTIRAKKKAIKAYIFSLSDVEFAITNEGSV